MLFTSLGSSRFISYTKTSKYAIEKCDELSFKKYKPFRNFVIATILPHDSFEEDGSNKYLDMLSEVSINCPPFADFIYFDDSETFSITQTIPNPPPAVILFYQGHLVSSFQFPDSQDKLAYQIASFFQQDNEVVETETELYSSLGGVDFAFIASKDHGTTAAAMLTKTLSILNSAKIVLVSDDLMIKMGLDPKEYGLFRQSDGAIVPCTNDPTSIYRASLPAYSEINLTTVASHNVTYVAYITDEFDNSTLNEQLFEMALRHPSFRFAYVLPDNFDIVAQVTKEDILPRPYFQIMNPTAGFSYPRAVKVTKDDFSAAEEYIKKVENGEIPKKFYSEEKPGDSTNPFVEYLIGTNYEQFISDTTHDLIVCFYNDTKTLEAYHDAAVEISKYTENARFGMIKFPENSCAVGFPYFVSMPHIAMYPAKNRTSVVPMFGRQTVQNIKLFVSQHMTLPQTIPFVLPEKLEAENDVLEVMMRMQQMPREVQLHAVDYIVSMAPVTGFDPFAEQ